MARRKPSRWHGLLPVHKKSGPTSHDVVDIARRALGERRIGHTGTLDPMAEGLLLLCVGTATRLQQYLLQWTKTYIGSVRLGWSTDTYDAEGERTSEKLLPPELTPQQLQDLASRFTGTIQQLPPTYSAKKVRGKKLYELARQGEEVSVEPKRVEVHELSLQQTQRDELEIRATVSSGFYVRSLAHDIGQALECGGHLRRLERTSIGPMSVEQAIRHEDLENSERPEDIIGGSSWIPLAQVSLPFPTVELNSSAADRFVHGQEVVVFRPGDEPLEGQDPVAVRHRDDLLGVGLVQHVMARGRSLNIRPALVLQGTTGPGASSKPTHG